jgi:hypothetical protein
MAVFFMGLEEMFDGDSADMCAGKFLLILMGGRVEGLACADPGVMTPIGVSGFFLLLLLRNALAVFSYRLLVDKIQIIVKHINIDYFICFLIHPLAVPSGCQPMTRL